jgi:serine kinase of HPr protein (carbohydrate metabolism regulator)
MSETVHATAVLVGADGVLIRGESGAGKTTLALALIERGGRLIADDRLTICALHGRIVASASQATLGMIELRGRGVMSIAHERSAVIRLVADIVDEEELERMPEEHQLTTTIAGIPLPRQPVPPAPGRAVRLVEAALGASKSPAVKGLRTTIV